jgi:hypothetical protein
MVLNTPDRIARYQLLALRGAINLEILGLKRQGRSASMLAKEQLGLPRNTHRNKVVEKLTELIG